jgi:hypothetical protein
MHQCICGKDFKSKKSLVGHQANCGLFKATMIETLKSYEAQILDEYLVKKDSLVMISQKYGFSYNAIKQHFIGLGIEVQSVWADSERRRLRSERVRETSIKRYGVDNPAKADHIRKKVAKTCEDRYGVSNGSSSTVSQIKHYILGNDVEPGQREDYQLYRNRVEILTKRNKKQMPFSGKCYYSGVVIHKTGFINDDLRASIDHKIPVIHGFLNNLPAEDIASVNNLVWCAKILNTYKRSMCEDQFYSSGIIERFKKYESYFRSQPK